MLLLHLLLTMRLVAAPTVLLSYRRDDVRLSRYACGYILQDQRICRVVARRYDIFDLSKDVGMDVWYERQLYLNETFSLISTADFMAFKM